MEQLASSFLALNVDGQQRLPFQAFRDGATAAAAAGYIPSYAVQNIGPFSLAPMTLKAIPNCQHASANQPSANQPSANLPANRQMEVEEEDEEMLPLTQDASANLQTLQTQIRRSKRLAAKPRVNYKEIAIIE